ncbi:MAG: hypothetical protein GF381_04570 [Candidatus Pacebacteria bacterium]|nr:hypothetical protein [Candidatus Paceibacterota bacterium]
MIKTKSQLVVQSIKNILSKNNFLLLLAFLAVFSFRSWYGLRFSSFGQDMARDLILTEQKIEQGQLLVGYGPKASVGNFYLAPFYYQLELILAYLTNNYVWTMKWVVIILESITPLIVFKILKLVVSKRASLILATLYALASLPTIFGTFAWNPNPIPFFTSLALWGWLDYLQTKQKWGLILGPLSVAISIHLHYQAVVLTPFWLLVLGFLFFKERRDLKYFLIGIGLAGLTFLPYIYFELQNNWHNTNSILNYFQSEHSQYYERVSKPAYVLTFLPAFFERVIFGENSSYNWFGRLIFFVGSLSWLPVLLLEKKPKKTVWKWLALYFGLILLMLRLYKGDKIDYYLSTLYLFPFILLAAISRLGNKLNSLQIIFSCLVLISFFWAGQTLAGKQPTHQLANLKEMMNRLENQLAAHGQTQAAFLFHNDDYINTIAYGLTHFTNLEINQQSQYLVEVYGRSQLIGWDQLPRCRFSRDYTYASLVKDQTDYIQLYFDQADYYPQLLLGRLENPPKPVGYRLYQSDLDYGSDLIYPELYYYNSPTAPSLLISRPTNHD